MIASTGTTGTSGVRKGRSRPTARTSARTASVTATKTIVAFAVMPIPRTSSNPTNSTIAIAKTFTVPPSPGGAVIAAGSVMPATCSSSALR